MGRVEATYNRAIDLGMLYGPKLILAFLTLIVGLWVIGGIARLTDRALYRSKVDETLRPFLVSLSTWVLKALLFISFASMVGIETTSFVAILGAAGLAVGLALQGSLTNFAGGVLLLIFRPYEVGHLIEAQGHLGHVKEIQIFTTIIVTLDNRRVIIPNGAVSNGSIINYTAEGKIRVDLTVAIAGDANIAQAREVLVKVMMDDPNVLQMPPPQVAVQQLSIGLVSLAVRPHTTPDKYWDVYFGVLENAKIALDAAGVPSPMPAQNVHLFKHEG